MTPDIRSAGCVSRRSAVVGLLATAVMAAAMLPDAAARPNRQSITDLPEGIQIEALAAAPDLPFRPSETSAFLMRYTYAPGAQLEVPYTGPVLAYVESGTLSLERIGSRVSILYPADIIDGQQERGRIAKRQVGEAAPVGGKAEVGSGGSVYAETGELGPTRNASSDPLILLIVQFVSESPSEGVTEVPVEGTPKG